VSDEADTDRTADGRVVIAPDKFKGSATAAEVAQSLAHGIRTTAPGIPLSLVPVADGGGGTVDAAVASGYTRVWVEVSGPLGDRVRAAFALDGERAVVELAQASGLERLPGGRLDALGAGTRGTGEVIRAALDAGARTIVLGLGGSSSTDGGTGMLRALGAAFLDVDGQPLPEGGGALTNLVRADLTGLDPRLAATEVVLASDVDNPLLGPEGAAAVYGPQKGATAADVALLDGALRRLVEALTEAVGPAAAKAAQAPGAGAAGGTGYAALAALGAARRSGIDVLLDALQFEQRIGGARLVITGEGSLDEQTLRGKAPAGVAQAAQRRGIPVAVVCGQLALAPDRWRSAGFEAVYALSDIEHDIERCMKEPGPLLEQLGEQLGRDLLASRR
jgi:glycerate 2-kinase